MKINVKSEIGELKKVLVHRPGKEVERIYPEIFEKILFDDVMYLDEAQREHDVFTNILKEEGVEVFYIEKLVAEVLDISDKIKQDFINEFLQEANIDNKTVLEECRKYFQRIKSNYELVIATIAGVTTRDVQPKFKNTLQDIVKSKDSYPIFLDPIPNILFQRDPMVSIYNGTKINNMWAETRKRETIYTKFVYKYHPDFKDINVMLDSKSKGTVEGGDIIIINEETILIGLSQRTCSEGIEELTDKLFEEYSEFKNMIAIQIPKSHATMHLDTVLTQMDYTKFSIDADMEKLDYTYFVITREGTKEHKGRIINLLKKYVSKDVKLSIVGGGSPIRAKREQWNDAANCLVVRPGTIIVYNRNKITNEIIKKEGIKVIEIPSSELSRGRGGPRCMAMPLYRENI